MVIASGGWLFGNYFGLSHLSLLLSIILIGHIVLFFIIKYYSDFLERGILKEAKLTLLISMSMFFILKTAEIFIIPKHFWKLNLVFIVLSYVLALILTNSVLRYIVWHLRQGYQPGNEKYVYTLTNGQNLEKLRKMFKILDPSIKIVGNTILDEAEMSGDTFISEYKMIDYIKSHVVDSAYIYVENMADQQLNRYIEKFEQFGIDVNIVYPSTHLKAEGKKTYLIVDNYPIVNCSTTNHNPWAIIISKLIDIFTSLVGLLICAIVGAMIALCIKLEDNGPIFFIQNRVGRNGRIFKFYKFRSMSIDAERQKEALMSDNEIQGNMFKMAEDPRITKVGKFIRKTSLDELPQFFNILRGDMSLVGTRPPLINEYEKYTASQKRRLSFKLGLTGNWQVSGRNLIQDFDEVVKLDVDYIDKWSVWLDIKIILKTFSTVLLRKGAL